MASFQHEFGAGSLEILIDSIPAFTQAAQVFGPSRAAAKLGMPRSTLESKNRYFKIDKNRLEQQ